MFKIFSIILVLFLTIDVQNNNIEKTTIDIKKFFYALSPQVLLNN